MTPDQAARVAQILTDNPDVRKLELSGGVTVVHGGVTGRVWVGNTEVLSRTQYESIPAMLQAYTKGNQNGK